MANKDFQEWVNNVVLVGRVTSVAEDIVLPSDDVLTRFRIVVPRIKPTTRTTVDTIDLVAFKPAIQKRAHSLDIDDVVEIEGALRRRFWKAGASVASRVEVEMSSLRKL
ncbi:MAG: single-stranded DNA-binding protein [Actinomycetes bacterium]